MALTRLQRAILEPYNKIMEIFFHKKINTTWDAFKQVVERAKIRTDISSHLTTIFLETVQINPSLIVELGVNKGASTYALSKAAMVIGSQLVSVDIRDHSDSLHWEKWNFIKMNDIDFAKQFHKWCDEKKIIPLIDLLFIDTSHEYQHTKAEIDYFFPLLARNATVIFHDTNSSGWYLRCDYTLDRGGDCKRGVIRAIEDYFKHSFNERQEFTELIDNWLIRHNPFCNGLMIMHKIGQ